MHCVIRRKSSGTHGGGGKYTIKEDMEKLTKNATVLEPFVVYGKGNSQTEQELDEWLKNLDK